MYRGRCFLDNLKSKIVERRPIPWGKTILVDEAIDERSRYRMDSLDAEIRMARPDWTDAQVEAAKKQEAIEDNYYNRAMDEISSAYTVEFHEDDVRRQEDALRVRLQLMQKDGVDLSLNDDELTSHARMFVLKQLIYEDLAKVLGIEVTDQSAKDFLQDSYKRTGKSVREYLDDPEKLVGVRDYLLDRLITERIRNAFGRELNRLSENNISKS